MIEQMEKSHSGGTTETKEGPILQTNNRVTLKETQPIIKQAPPVVIAKPPVVMATPPSKSNVPKIPGVPLPPPLSIPLPPKKVSINRNILNRMLQLFLLHKKIKLQN